MMNSFYPRAPIHFLSLIDCLIYDQLQIEEGLLRADNRNWCIINHGTLPAIVMGISGIHEKLINQKMIEKAPVPIVRRFSGGGTVFVDMNTVFVTWIFNTNEINIPCCPQKIHLRMADFYQQAFPSIDMKLKENDYVIGERKWGGNAQYLCKGRWLHHSSLLWDYDPENMEYLLMPSKVPQYRSSRSHKEFLCCLKEYFATPELLRLEIVKGLYNKFDVIEMPLESVADVLDVPHRKATCYFNEFPKMSAAT